MPEPRDTQLRLWGKPPDKGDALAWEDVQRHLEDAECYWLVTTGADGTPKPRPVWGVWLDDRLLLSVGSSSHWSNIKAGRGDVSVHLGDAHDVVIVEGSVGHEVDSATLARMVEIYNPKYSWDFTADSTGPVTVVTPRVVMAWRAGPAASAKSDPFPLASGRWEFPPADVPSYR